MVELHNVNLGYFGGATYDLDNSEWHFSRKPERHELTRLGDWRTVVTPAIRFPTPALPRNTQSVNDAVKGLVRDFPELASAVQQLPELEPVSAAAVSATSVYDATAGDLLSFGSITCHGKGGKVHQPKRVVATATGEVGNILCLQVSSRERYGWGDFGQGIWVEGPSTCSSESGYWNEEAAPIQQICFAQTGERSSFLVVRLPLRTVVFQPKYLHRRKASPSKYYEFPPSDIDARPILTVRFEDTGGIPHAHVAFNPDYQRQFALIDQRGEWSIWDIDDGFRGTEYSVNRSAKGSVLSAEEQDELVPKEDGWARILWVGDANTVAVATRRHLAVFNYRNGAVALKCPSLIPKKSADWILDVVKHPSNAAQVFVLTSAQLFLLSITAPPDGHEEENARAGASVLISYPHYRGSEDMTLRLCIHKSEDQDCLVAIHSCLNQLVSVYCFAEVDFGHSSLMSVSDPVSIDLHGLEKAGGSSRIRQLHITRLRPGTPSQYGRGEHVYEEQGVQFYRLSIVLSDLSIREILLYAFGKSEGRSREPVPPTTWVKTIRNRRCFGQNLVDESDLEDDFIEPDGLVYPQLPRLKDPYELPKRLERRTKPAPWYSYDYSSLYDALVHISPAASGNRLQETVDVEIVVNEIKKLLEGKVDSAEPPLGTL
ncbi:hypothetical protein CC80DRAFT_244510 [Byssothecium circinans]|uniref:RRN6 beta-propeller domain-containing protein n=1 Tax=Byssothecium circinans TaxID=147558 RepID=A0A6A5TEM6_9PLEO|nr:hypothetical protein CC80DRAFT_244510 [Byssothecium circinans]